MEAFEKWLIAEVTKGNVEIDRKSAEQAWKAALLHAAERMESIKHGCPDADSCEKYAGCVECIMAAIRKEAGE